MIHLVYEKIKGEFSRQDIDILSGALPESFRRKNSEYLSRILGRGHISSVCKSLIGLKLLLDIVPGAEDFSPIKRGEHGKPFFDRKGAPSFSISHSDELAACAVIFPENGEASELGIDCEAIYKKDPHSLCERFFSEGEKQYVFSADDKKLAFTEIWTKKEAYIKHSGFGLSLPLSSFDVTADLGVHIETFTVGDNIVSLCTEKKYFPVKK